MKRTPITPSDLHGVVAVPPLPRLDDRHRSLNLEACRRLLNHLAAGGLSRFMFGGNAFAYHLTLREYAQLLDWMPTLPDDWWMLPAAGPSYGRLMDQADLLRNRGLPAIMLLPCSDPRDAAGLERGIREFVEASSSPVILYLKSEDTFGSDAARGWESIGRLCAEGFCVGIKYAIVRENPGEDPYLKGLLERVDRKRVVSGIGERPAVVHLRDWNLTGFTTGSGCVAPRLSQRLLENCLAGRWDDAAAIRERFLPLEDCRDAWNPAKVLHHAVDLAGIAPMGPIPPFLSAVEPCELTRIREAIVPLLGNG